MTKPYFKIKTGFTLVETLVVVGIFALLVVSLTTFESGLFRQNNSLRSGLLADQDARAALRDFVTSLRAAAPAETGAYPIALAAAQSLTFYSDLDGDGRRDQVRYFVSGTELRRGVILAAGFPAIYDPGTEQVTTVVRDLWPVDQTIFSYYDQNYRGTGAPLGAPVNIAAIRLVRMTLSVDQNPVEPPTAAVYQSQVVIRSLKDNL